MQRDFGKLDVFLILLVSLAAFCGVLNLYGQEYQLMNAEDHAFYEYKWFKQLVRVAIGFTVMFLMVAFHYQLIGSYALGIYLVSIVLLTITLIFGTKVNGARSWLQFGSLNVGQPAEIAKLTTIILLSKYLVLKEKDISHFSELILPFIILIVPMSLILVQPDFGTALSFIPIFFMILFIGGADIWQIGSLVFFGFFSLVIPLFIQYHKISLLTPLTNLLDDEGKGQLAYAVRILQKKVWDVEDGNTFDPVLLKAKGLLKVFAKDENYEFLKTAIVQVKREGGGILLRFWENYELLSVIGILCLVGSGSFLTLKIITGKTQKNWMISLGVIGVTLFALMGINKYIKFSDYQINRLTAFANPEQFRDRAGYQLRASKIATGSGGFFGKGITHDGMTSGNLPLVPEATTDFSYASWSERTGFLGSVFLLMVLMAIPLRGLQIAFEAKDRFGALLASGITVMIFFHLFINMGIVLGLLPVTGLPLSFISFGGSNLLVSFLAIGLLLNIRLRKHAN